MGRLDKAMRRAAEDQAAVSSTTADLPLASGPTDDLPLPSELTADELPSEGVDVPLAVEPLMAEPAAPAASFSTSTSAIAPSRLPEELTARPSDEGLITEMALRRQINSQLATKTVVDDSMMPASREQYRRLAAALHQAQRTTGFKVVMVASAVAGEGKTLTASNLAMTLSESYRRDVLLVDADLRRPSLHLVFQVPGAPGLSDGLVTADEPKLPLHRVSERLAVLPAGKPTSDPIGALTSERMRRLIDEAREVFDWVVIDTPPVGLLTDAALLSSMADGVVRVVKSESTPHDMVNRAVQAIGKERVIGTVLNRARAQSSQTNYDYYKYYAQAEPGAL